MATGLKGKTEAWQLAVLYENAAKIDQAEAEAVAELQRIFARKRGEAVTTRTVRAVMNDWLADRAGEVEEASLIRYRSSVDRFLSHLGIAAEAPIYKLTEQDVKAFRAARMAEVSKATANADLNVLRFVFKRAVTQRLLVNDPTAQLKDLSSRSRKGSSVRRPFTMDELQRILNVSDLEWEGMILFGLYTVQRLKDVALVTWSQVDGGVLNLTRKKTNDQAIIPLHRVIKDYLATLKKGGANDPIFPNASTRIAESKSSAQLSNQFYSLMVRAGVMPKRSKTNTGAGHGKTRRTNQLSFHCLRHTGNTLLKNAGAGEAVVRDIVGHESTDVSRVYTHIDERTKSTAIDKMPSVRKTKTNGAAG